MNLYIGQEARISKRFSESEVRMFAALSMDTNPIHLDEEYAGNFLFGRRIVHGFLTGSLISAVIGTLMPGPGAIYLHQEMDFVAPVFHDEEITAIVRVTGKKEGKDIYYLETQCVGENNEVKITGKAIIKYKG